MRVVGPLNKQIILCKSGDSCVLSDVKGVGLKGGDRVLIAQNQRCGMPDSANVDSENMIFVQYGISVDQLKAMSPWEMYPLQQLIDAWKPSPSRASVPGFLGDGRSEPTGVAGQFSWRSASAVSSIYPLAAGEFSVCWCGEGAPCATGSDFNVDLGTMQVIGPLIIPPGYVQSFFCSTYNRCRIQGVMGRMRRGDRLAVMPFGVSCGLDPFTGEVALALDRGVPNGGITQPSSSETGETHRFCFHWTFIKPQN